MREYKPNQRYYTEFTIHNEANNLVNSDVLPSISCYRNNILDSEITLTPINISTGVYSVSGDIPSNFSNNDRCSIYVNCTVSGATKGGFIDQITIVSYDMGDIGTETTSHPTLAEIESSNILAKEATLISISGDMEVINTIASLINELHNERFGKWEIDTVSKTMTVYDLNNVVLKVFDLTEGAVNAVRPYIRRTPR